MEIIKRLARTTAIVLSLIAAQPVWAEFEAGQRALDAGDMNEALTQWREAATNGDGRAMLELGRLYLQGLGVIQDYVEAHKWFNLSASRGVAEALEERDALAAKMTPTQVATAQERAAAWQSGGTPDSMQQADTSQPPAQAIREAQALLAALGYDPGQTDGVWGGRTAEAYRAFLNDTGLPVGDVLTPDALLAMRALAGKRGTGAGASPTANAPRPAPVLQPDALHRAAKAGDSEGLKAALAAGVDVNALDGQGWTALMHAANKGYPQLAELLLEASADPDIQAPDGATALFIATVLEQSEVIESLMKTNADISILGPKGKTAVDMARLRFGEPYIAWESGMNPGAGTARYKSDLAYIAWENGMNLGVIGLIKGMTWREISTWYLAAEIFFSEIGRYPSAMGEDSQGVTDLCRVFRSQIPLGSQVILAKALLEEGADVDKGLPLFCAASASNFKAVKLLIEHGADIHAKDWEGRTPLHSASTYSDNQTASTIRLLIEKGVDVNVNDDYGVTPLHIAGSMSNGTAAEVLIEHGADVNAKGQYPYETPLHAVISGSCGGFDNIVKLLIAHGADLNARNIENKTPLQALREGGCEESDITHGTMLLSR